MSSSNDGSVSNHFANSNVIPDSSGDQQLQNIDQAFSLPYDPNLLVHIGAKQIISLFIPVSICMLLVALVSKTVPYFSTTDVYLIYTPFHTPNADIITQTWQTIANVAIFFTIVVAMTFLLVLLFKFKCYKCLTGWLIATTFLLVFVISFIFFTEVLRASMIFFDSITFTILLWNFGALGLVSIHWRSPLILQQAYLIFNSVQMALIFLKFLPKWTCWVLLGVLAIWDLIAVLCPRGPLRMLVEMSQERNQPLFPAMIYSTTAAYFATAQPAPAETGETLSMLALSVESPERAALLRPPTSVLKMSDESPPGTARPNDATDGLNQSKSRSDNQEQEHAYMQEQNSLIPPLATDTIEPRPQGTQGSLYTEQTLRASDRLRNLQEDVIQREEHGVKLGLGDFIFYSLLIGRASLDGDVLTVVACYVAILVGVCLTIVALGVARKALPALPVSITCGIIFYFSTAAVITPFIRATSEKRLFF